VAGLLLILLEAAHGAFVLSMVGLAALVTAAVAAAGLRSLAVTVPVFLVVSLGLLLLLRPLAVRRLRSWPASAATNVQALVGQTGRVVVPFDDRGVGYVLVGGERWRAHVAEGWDTARLSVGSTCTVLAVQGATLEVCPEPLTTENAQDRWRGARP